jgi:hypothetical protein
MEANEWKVIINLATKFMEPLLFNFCAARVKPWYNSVFVFIIIWDKQNGVITQSLYVESLSKRRNKKKIRCFDQQNYK